MALITADRFTGSGQKVQRVRLLVDQKVKGLALKAGDTVDLDKSEALYLKNVERVAFVANAVKEATR
jgi:hypothetical protein